MSATIQIPTTMRRCVLVQRVSVDMYESIPCEVEHDRQTDHELIVLCIDGCRRESVTTLVGGHIPRSAIVNGVATTLRRASERCQIT
jgi:hypothetical protein